MLGKYPNSEQHPEILEDPAGKFPLFFPTLALRELGGLQNDRQAVFITAHGLAPLGTSGHK